MQQVPCSPRQHQLCRMHLWSTRLLLASMFCSCYCSNCWFVNACLLACALQSILVSRWVRHIYIHIHTASRHKQPLRYRTSSFTNQVGSSSSSTLTINSIIFGNISLSTRLNVQRERDLDQENWMLSVLFVKAVQVFVCVWCLYLVPTQRTQSNLYVYFACLHT